LEVEKEADIAVLDEPLDDEDDVLVYDSIIEAGTLNKLILWLFSGSSNGKQTKDYVQIVWSS
jgi:hypothetical protein